LTERHGYKALILHHQVNGPTRTGKTLPWMSSVLA
jgi:hypothetical protein